MNVRVGNMNAGLTQMLADFQLEKSRYVVIQLETSQVGQLGTPKPPLKHSNLLSRICHL